MIYYEDVLKALNKCKADYVVFGGLAAILYGVPRTTMDIDIMIDLTPKNIDKVFMALYRIGYRSRLPVSVEEFKDEKKRKLWQKEKNMKVFRFFHIKDDLKIVDLSVGNLMHYKKVRKNWVRVGTLTIPVIAFHQLRALKKKAARPKDLADLEDLKRLERLQ